MGRHFDALKVSEHVWWVGAVDWGLRDFHGYTTPRGTTYNAYLIVADDVILVDAVKAPFKDELMARVASVTDPAKIRYIISNHSEPDHTSALPAVVADVRPEKVFCSKMGVKDLEGYYHMDGLAPVGDLESMELGGVKLTFVETPMIHWPDSMMTYLADDRLLFSQDGFGMHLSTSERWADELDSGVLRQENARYFANILLPYRKLIVKLLDRVVELGVPIDVICPDHGPMWRRDHELIFNLYRKWCAQEPSGKAVIVFDTMWGSTAIMARAIEEGLKAAGANVVVLPMHSNDRSDVLTEVLEAGALLVGTPTINNNMFPSLADTLTYMRGLKPANLVGAAFGSYGWSGEGAGQVAGYLEQMKVELVGEPLNLKFAPHDEGIEKCRALGEAVGARLKEVVSGG